MTSDLAAFNDDWLAAWSEKDVARLIGFYTDDVVYRDARVPEGVNGSGELTRYLETLFAEMPSTRYVADEIWPIQDGYCGRWYCRLGGASDPQLRGFDLVILRAGRISFNEVFIHHLGKPAARSAGG